MKRILLTVLLALAGSLVFSEERIAVFPFEDMDNVFTPTESAMFYREFSNEFTNRSAGRFSVVPRQEVEKLINVEAAFQLSDFSARAKTAEMQRVLNGTQILSGLIGRTGSTIRITVSLFTYPELQQLPGGATLSVFGKNELFDMIPELVQRMQNNISEQGLSPTRRVSLSFAGDALAPREKQTIASGLRNAMQTHKISFELDENLNAAAGYGFIVNVYLSRPRDNPGYLQAEVTVAFSQRGRVLYQTGPYYITETTEILVARRITDRLKDDEAFFNRVKEY